MNIFRFSKKYYISQLLVIIFDIVLIVAINSVLITIILSVLILSVLCSMLNIFFIRYILDDEKIVKKTLFSEKALMYWKDVHDIAYLVHRKQSIGVFTSKEKFIINNMISNSEHMIDFIVDRCRQNDNVRIDSKLL